jgi:hypothetical protein
MAQRAVERHGLEEIDNSHGAEPLTEQPPTNTMELLQGGIQAAKEARDG